MTDISIPQSVQDYFTRKGIRTAVDLLLEQNDEYLPENLDWDELRSFHKSVLAAYTIRTDYAILLLDAWDAIWKPALSAAGVGEALPITYEEFVRPSSGNLFRDSLYRTNPHPSDRHALIWTRIFYRGPETGFRLCIGTWTDENVSILARETAFDELWIPESDESFDGWFATRDKAFSLKRDSNVFDPAEIRKAADAALHVILV